MALSASSDTRKASFKAPYTYRSREYRTPSPPLRFVEPVSPSPHDPAERRRSLESTRKRKAHHAFENGIKQELDAAQGNGALFRKRSGVSTISPLNPAASAHVHGHEKSHPSALDVFAAVATSPQLGSFSPQLQHARPDYTWRQSLPRPINRDFHRASKRTKSESFDLRFALAASERPATSHVGPGVWNFQEERAEDVSAPNTMQARSSMPAARAPPAMSTLEEDAELLLGFSMASRAASSNRTEHHHRSHHQSSLHAQSPHPSQLYSVADVPIHDGYTRVPPEVHAQHHVPVEASQQGPSYGSLRGLGLDRPVTPAFEGHRHNLPQQSPLDRPRESPITPTDTPEHDQSAIAESTDKKTRIYRGWPKGKPRGPRNTTTEGKRAKKTSGTKRTSTASRKKPKSETSSAPAAEEAIMLPRRKSFDALPRPSHFTGHSSFAGTRSRSQSVPTNVRMVVRQISIDAQRPTNVIENICGDCNRTKNAANGNHDYWINCNGCDRWFHTTCAGFESERKVKEVDKFFCKGCESKFGSTTYVRKSTRAHASVDYAGLHEGKIRTAVDVNEHHYIQPIKDGQIQFQPETFARVPPELITADFFERSGMGEPVLIPAEWNPRPYADDEQTNNTLARCTGEDNVLHDDLEYDFVRDEGQDKLDMVIPRGLTVRRVAELYGPEERVDVIDVKLQEGEDRRWNMRQWADYYETEGEKPVRNVISLEVSRSKLGRLIRRPRVVRDLDLQDSVWPQEDSAKGVYPKVQFYCLMSVADSYTDFHIDFGGSSVYYHIIKGRKTFFFIPPKPKHLKKYEEWCLSPNQNNVFLGDETKECYRVDLYPGDTMLIPSGWIHAVWTPSDSLVIGGNFLTRMHYGMQIQINDIEKNTGVARKFRYPYFQKIMWYAVLQYLQQDPLSVSVVESLCRGEVFERQTPVWMVFDDEDEDEDEDADADANEMNEEVAPPTDNFNARYYSRGEIEGLVDLLQYVHRTVWVSLGKAGVAKNTQEAVTRSLPKGYGEPLDLLKTFAMWAAWKRGNEQIPSWAYPDAELTEIDGVTNAADKKKSTVTAKRSERQANRDAAASRKDSKASKLDTDAATVGGFLEKQTSDANSLPAPGSLKAFLPRYGVKMNPEPEAVQPQISKVSTVPNQTGPDAALIGAEMDTRQVTPAPRRASVEVASASTSSGKGPQILPANSTPPEARQEPPSSNSAKQPRRQACINCRLSKRRCVHDENGRIDPVKAQEPSIPRGPRGAKRSKDGAEADSVDAKKTKTEEYSPTASSEMTEPLRTLAKPGFQPNLLTSGASHEFAHNILGQHSRALGILPGPLSKTDMDNVIDPRLESLGLPLAPQVNENGQGVAFHGEQTDATTRAGENVNGMGEEQTKLMHAQTSESAKSTSASHKSSPLTEMEPSPLNEALADGATELNGPPKDSEETNHRGANSPHKSPSLADKARGERRPTSRLGINGHPTTPGSPTLSKKSMHSISMGSEAIDDCEEDENERLARELQSEEFGLRRRSK